MNNDFKAVFPKLILAMLF